VTSAAPAALEVTGLSAAYGPYRALFGVSFGVPDGGGVALIGPNGAGKSTVARTVSGLVAPTEGRISLCGRDVTGWPAWRIARSGMAHVPEGGAVFAGLSVEENLVLAFRRRRGRASVGRLLRAAYERFTVLGERPHQRAGTLSGGQQRLLSLATVLVAPPRLVVADELSLGLAPLVVDDVYAGLAELRAAGTALLLVEQQVERVLSLADRAVVLQHGTVAYDGPSDGASAALARVVRATGSASGGAQDEARGDADPALGDG
jgi:branched-chain amino acid transport system ATP-binding protein